MEIKQYSLVRTKAPGIGCDKKRPCNNALGVIVDVDTLETRVVLIDRGKHCSLRIKDKKAIKTIFPHYWKNISDVEICYDCRPCRWYTSDLELISEDIRKE